MSEVHDNPVARVYALMNDLEEQLREPCAPNDRTRARGMLVELRRELDVMLSVPRPPQEEKP
jgi:hypothetical protein